MSTAPVDYSALADQARKNTSDTPQVDYAALAEQARSGQQPQSPPAPKPESTLETAYRYSGIPGLIEMGKGAVKGTASTMFHGGDLIRRATGMDRVIDRPEVKQGITPTNTAQKIGYGGEQAAEFLAPAGLVGKAGKVVEAATKLPAARVLARAVLEGASAGGVTTAQTSGDMAAASKTALAAGGTSAVLGAVSQLPMKDWAKRLYQSALKPAPSMDNAEREAIIQTGLREGIVLNSNVVDEVQGRISKLNDQIAQGIQDRSAAGATADPEAVAAYTNRSASRFKNQVNPETDLANIEKSKQEFLRTNSKQAPYTKIAPGVDEEAGKFVPVGTGTTQVPQDIPLATAQKMKSGTYSKLKYGEVSGAEKEAQKDLARGLKDQIVKAFPEIAGLNAKESSLLALEASLERFVGRHGNHELIGIGTPLTTLAGHAAGMPVIPLALTSMALKNSAVRSRLAIALARSRNLQQSRIPAAVGAIAAPGVMPPPGEQPQQ